MNADETKPALLAPLGYHSGRDDQRAYRNVQRLAAIESTMRWLGVAAIVATQWQWFSMSSLSIYALLIALVVVPLWLLIACTTLLIAAATKNQGDWPASRWRRRLISVTASLALAGSAVVTSWPFYFAFFVSKPFLSRLADQAAAGKNVKGWHWAGVWIISDVRVEPDGSVGMYFNYTGSGWCGVVRYATPTSPPVSSNNGRHALGGNWELVDED